MINVSNLCKNYGSNKVIDNISFTVDDGEIVGFLGPNGAGKTTTLNMITGYLGATGGDITINGFNMLDKPLKAKEQIGYLPDSPPVYGDMTVNEYLSFAAEMKHMKNPQKSQNISEVKETLNLTEVEKRLIRNLSKGFKQRVGLAAALLGDPKVLILDEPTVGLDPKQIIEMRELIKTLGQKHTVLFSSHNLAEVSNICDKVIIINKGQIVASDTPQQLSARLTGSNNLILRIKGDRQAIEDALSGMEIIHSVTFNEPQEENASDVVITGNENTDIREAVFFAMANHSLPILHMKTFEYSLEDIFLRVTERNDSTEEPEKQNGDELEEPEELTQELTIETVDNENESEASENDGDI